MKLVEAPGGIQIFVSNDEHKMYESLAEEKCKSEMSEREQYLAQELVNRGVVKRSIREGKTYYSKIKRSF